MLRYLKIVVLTSLLSCGALVVQSASADESKEALQRILEAIKAARSLDPAIEAIDWQGAFDALAPDVRTQARVTNAKELKARELERFHGMSDQLIESLKKNLASATGERKDVIKKMLDNATSGISEQSANATRIFSETEYSIGEVREAPPLSQIHITRTRGGQSSEATVEMVLVRDRWLLKSALALNPIPGAGGVSSLIGAPIVTPGRGVVRVMK